MSVESTAVRAASLQALFQRGAWRMETPHSSEYARLYWITKGQGRVRTNGVGHNFHAHMAIFLPPRTMYSFDSAQQIQGTRICFPADLASLLPEDTLFLRVRDARSQGQMGQMIELLASELQAHSNGWHAASRSYAALLAVQIERLRDEFFEPGAITGSSQRIVEGYTALIEDHLTEGLGVASFAQLLGITPTHLTRVCREITGKTASNLLHERVIGEARRLLEDTDTPIRKIAEDLGFGSAAYFTRAFGQRTGVTPSVARLSSRQSRPAA